MIRAFKIQGRKSFRLFDIQINEQKSFQKRFYSFSETQTTHQLAPQNKISKCQEKPNKFLMGLSREELKQELSWIDSPSLRTKQVWHWMYHHGERNFKNMTTLKGSLRDDLYNKYQISQEKIVTSQKSQDGTHKFLLDFNGQKIETVFIPDVNRGTVCVSSQVGCTLSCTFCHTGTQPLVRNLTAGEIVGQVLSARRELGDLPPGKNRMVTNIVFMGQGEPLYNYRSVQKAIRIISDGEGLSIGKSKIVVSTSGVVPNIYKLAADFPTINLAISLHAVNDDLRSEIVPCNRQWGLKELLEACKQWPVKKSSRIGFEYVMLKNVNDSESEARELARLVSSFPSYVNIIPFNPWPGSNYECSSEKQILRFAQILEENGVDAPIRWPRGRDILAACGQLKTESTKENSNSIQNS